ncbi:MAG: ABC transporter substrate-binding protein, partial [Deltaproteobacteria bacterium]|nr:ABC transporter substrate-binding protein [Deltaproteobacteria bacterium]
MTKKQNHHPWFYELATYMKQGRMDRREFLRYAGALGVSASAAYATAGLWNPHRASAATIRRGGVFKISAEVLKLAHPSQISWGRQADQLQQLLEPLVIIRDDGVPRPYLLENWQASDDLKTWTLNLRRGITWNNGDAFTADDVVFTFKQWMDKAVNSTMRTLFGPLMSSSGIEKVNQHQVKLNLDTPSIGVPFFLYDNRALVMNHRTFEGDILKNPVGTGPYTLGKYVPGERAVFKARKDYWQKGADGMPLPYLDEIHFIDLGSEAAPQMA